MASISDKVQQIRQAVYGKDVRESIASGIEAINSEVENTTARQASLETTFEQLIINAGNSNAEIVDARITADNTVFPTLRDRLNAMDFNSIKQTPIPPKIGVLTKSPKLVIVEAPNKITVVQYIGGKYAVYKFNTENGDTGEYSVGGTWDLIRLKKAILSSYVYVAKTTIDSYTGTLSTLYAPALENQLEIALIANMPNKDSSQYMSATGDRCGVGVYKIEASGATSTVTWKVKIGNSRKCNILIYGTAGSSASADILVNGIVVKSFNPRQLYFNSTNHYGIIEFEIPLLVSLTNTVDVTLRNNDTSNLPVYFSCLNFMQLKDFDGRDVDFYKVFTTDAYWINSDGASDYAIFDHELQKWVGSYHGGETAIEALMTWYGTTPVNLASQYSESRIVLLPISSITGWTILPNFKMQQLTNINNKGKMLSIFDFDTDGTIDMLFSFFDGNIVVEDFYTALTCTELGFTHLRYPQYKQLTSDYVYLTEHDGHIIQYNPTKRLSLGIRHSKFTKTYTPSYKANGWIVNNSPTYKKYYYGAVEDFTRGLLITNLQFRKALDFIYE